MNLSHDSEIGFLRTSPVLKVGDINIISGKEIDEPYRTTLSSCSVSPQDVIDCVYTINEIGSEWGGNGAILEATSVCDQSLMYGIKCHNGTNLCLSFTQRNMKACEKGTLPVI
jgi:hypothetical protein